MTTPRTPLGRICLVLGLVFLLAQQPILAGHGDDHDRARAALQAGEVLPLMKILEKVQRTYPGDMLEAKLEREDGRWIYELKVLQPGGVLLRLDVDAKTAEVLKSKQRGLPAQPLKGGGRH